MKKILGIVSKGLSFVGVFLLMVLLTVYASLLIICYGPSKNARDLFITTFLETGMFKFIPHLVLSNSKIEQIVESNKLAEMKTEIDTGLIDVQRTDEIEIIPINGSTYYATLMIVHDPSRVKVGTIHPFGDKGKTLDVIVKENDALAGINGGIYQSSGNSGGKPMGLLVSEGKIVWNSGYGNGYYLIGFDESDKLRIISLQGKSPDQISKLVAAEKIRDAVTFQEEASGDNNHFVKLIVNGEKRLVSGLGSGQNPRTVIGQREDGAVLFLVTDGRGKSGHVGANASQLIEIMDEYGAVNAANLDGGSSSVMYYDNEYLMTSVTFYYTNSSWNLPDAFIVTK